jgi:hypothetical protein
MNGGSKMKRARFILKLRQLAQAPTASSDAVYPPPVCSAEVR